METQLNVNVSGGGGGETYVVDGATLSCSKGSSTSSLVVTNHNIYIQGIPQANIADHVGGENIHSFGLCFRSDPPPPCIMATSSKWANGKSNVHIDDYPALLNVSVNFCSCGGVISIVDDGQ